MGGGGGGGIDSDNGLSVRCQVIVWTNAGLILTGPLGTYLSVQSNFHSRKSLENVVCKTEAILSRSQCDNDDDNNNNNNNDNNNDNNNNDNNNNNNNNDNNNDNDNNNNSNNNSKM